MSIYKSILIDILC